MALLTWWRVPHCAQLLLAPTTAREKVPARIQLEHRSRRYLRACQQKLAGQISSTSRAAAWHWSRLGCLWHAFSKPAFASDELDKERVHMMCVSVCARTRPCWQCTSSICFSLKRCLLKPVSFSIVLYQILTRQLTGAAHKSRESHATRKVNNPVRTPCATSLGFLA